MASDPNDPHFYDYVREPDLLLRAAAESLYEAKGNPFSNPEPVVNTVHWRRHEEVNPKMVGLGRVVDLMVDQEYAMRDSKYASQRQFSPKLKLLGEEKMEFCKLLLDKLTQPLLPCVQELMLLGEYRKALRDQPNDLSPTRAAQLSAVESAMNLRACTIAGALGDAVERCNVRAFPVAAEGRGR